MAKRSSGNDSDLFWSVEGRLSCFLALVLLLTSDGVVMGARTKPVRDMELPRDLKRLNKPAVRSIQSEDGDIVDCVDIYKQPAFDHPLLKNHTIQMKPSFNIKGDEGNSSSMELLAQQLWEKSGSCPEGTVPIQRSHLLMENSSSLGSYAMKYAHSSSLGSYAMKYAPGTGRVEIAGAQIVGGPYYAAQSKISVWNTVPVESNEYSLNSIIISNNRNFIECGWGVHPMVFGDSVPRLYVNWRRFDGDKQTGCYNLRCPGFIQVSDKIKLGSVIHPLSTFGGDQYVIKPMIIADNQQPEKWWFVFGDEYVGYWPMSVFNDFTSATQIQWAGGVLNTAPRGQHTDTHLGSGHLGQEGWQRAAYFSQMTFKNSKGDIILSRSHAFINNFEGCYNVVEGGGRQEKGEDPIFYYGGPGGPGCDLGN